MFIRVLTALCLAMALSQIAYAQTSDNSINVVGESGQIQSLEIPQTSNPAPKPTSNKAPVKSAPAKQPLSTQDLLKQMENALGNEVESLKKESTQKLTPPKAPPQKEKIQKSPPVKKKARQNVRKKNARTEIKKRTHTPSDIVPVPPSAKPAKPALVQPAPIVIDRNYALRKALDIAPPSRSFTVFENRTFKDRIVYQVTFKTTSGFHDILIDAETGDVLKR